MTVGPNVTASSKAMVFSGPGQPLELREFDRPRLGEGELLVEVSCCTLCGSDVHTFEGHRSAPCPIVLGHETIGRVAMLPAGVDVHEPDGAALRVGDRVTWSVAASCGDCFFCRRGLVQKCEKLFKYGHERAGEDHPLSGGLAEHCHLAAGTAVMRVPDALSDEVACPANCATATVAAALRVGGDCRESVVLVQGAGMLGLTACAMARHRGAREVIACDLNGERLAWAERFGATKTVSVDSPGSQLRRVVEASTSGRGVDLALEMSGSPSSLEMGLDLLRIGATYVLVGAVSPTRPASVAPELVVRKLLSIHGVHNYVPQDLASALEFLTDTQAHYPFADLVPVQFSLNQANAAFEHARKSGALRVAVLPGV